MANEIRTQKTMVYVLAAALGVTPTKIPNVFDAGEFGPQADDIDVTNFDSEAKEYLTGLPDNGEITLQINQDSSDAVHQFLESEAGSGNRFPFCVALSESETAPTASGGNIVPAADRTCYIFTASVKSYRGAIKTNDAVRRTVTLRISGAITTSYPS